MDDKNLNIDSTKSGNEECASLKDEISEKKVSAKGGKKKNGVSKNTTAKVSAPPDKKAETVSENTNEEGENKDNILEAPTLDSLVIDDDSVIEKEKEESRKGFDDFLADYKKAIKATLNAAKSAFSHGDENDEPPEDDKEEVKADEDFADAELVDAESGQLEMNIDEELMPSSVFDDNTEDTSNKYDPEKPRIIDNIFDFVELFIFTLAAVLVITTFFFKHTIVDGDSMMNTLHNSEHLIISDVFYTPKRGDIIVFQDPLLTRNEPWVKRVIGLPGDTVEVKINKDGEHEIYINEKLLEEDYDYNSGDRSPVFGGPWVVGEDEVFVLGDNRYNSTDSRIVGPIKIDSILGKVLLRIYPFDKFGTIK